MNTMQATFDIDALLIDLERELAPSWAGAPLSYHEQYTRPADLDAAFERWKFENGNFGCIPYSHMWHKAHDYGTYPTIAGHGFAQYVADARCDGGRFGNSSHEHAPGEIPHEYMTQLICETCEWHTIGRSWNDMVEEWHDHALPGWRNLPAVPHTIVKNRDTKKGGQRFQEWIEEHYPHEWQQDGYPIITERTDTQIRHVPARSPWGGYDLSATQ